VKLLVIGGGGREHALCWKLKRDDPALELHAAPGNPGIATLAQCHSVVATDTEKLVALAQSLSVDLVVVGPEAPLATGVADRLRHRDIAVFGPSAKAARIESSKSFAKEIMARAGVPTAQASTHTEAREAKRAARALGIPVVIKASGLAAGKGVVVANSEVEADRAIDDMLVRGTFGASGSEVLVEEFMTGEEISIFAITDGSNFALLPPSQDHKRLLEGDRGPNTGGMGAYAPVSIATPAVMDEVRRMIIQPTLDAMADAGAPFTGLLYAGLMLTTSGPRVVEFNCRFGDPETQAVLPLLADPLLPAFLSSTGRGELSAQSVLAPLPLAAVTIVIASAGYPDSPRTGDMIQIPRRVPDGVTIFHAGTAIDAHRGLITAGGRVLAVTATAPTIENALELARGTAAEVSFDGAQWRRDIAWRELERQWHGAAASGA
jgi:phosphoribosylamine--glycine ligase